MTEREILNTDWREPQPSDGPDYHADHAYWVENNTRDAAVERAALERAVEAADKAQDDIRGIIPLSSTILRPMVRAALAAARAGKAERALCKDCGKPEDEHDEFGWKGLRAQRGGEAVDREVLAEVAGDLLMTCATTTNHSMYRADVEKVLDAVWQAGHDAALAARGDAAPTEVEWGVRYPKGVEPDRVRPASSEQDARSKASGLGSGVVVQRTVSAWREVQP